MSPRRPTINGPLPLSPAPGPYAQANAPAPANVPVLPNTGPGDDWVIDFEDVQAFKEFQADHASSSFLQKQWLASEANWKYRVGKGWKGKRILGVGGQGIVGHWTYTGDDRDQKSVKDLAVKQVLRFGPAYIWGDGLESEARWLSMLARAKTPHIVKMYKHLMEEEGQKTFSQDWGLVQRIFLEFCPAGDLGSWMNKYINNPRNVSEEDLWNIFQCLARGLFVIHHGSEDASTVRYMPGAELVHFDLKPQNVLIGDQALDNEHRNQPPYKITDFGVAKKVPIDGQENAYLKKWEYTGTVPWFAPEQISRLGHPEASKRPWISLFNNIFNPLIKNPKYGSATNVWQVGLVIQCLMRRRRQPDWPNYTVYQSTATPRLANGGQTVGLVIDAEQDQLKSSIYSRTLRNLIAECLLLTPANRPSVLELVTRTKEGTETVQMSKGQLPGPPLPQWQEPVVSAEWHQKVDVNPLAAALSGMQVKSGSKPNKPSRPPVIAQPAPSALLGQEDKAVPAGAAPETPVRLAPAGANLSGAIQAGTSQADTAIQGAPPEAANVPAVAVQNAQATATSAVLSRPVPANGGTNTARILRVIVQTKSRFGGMVAGAHKTFSLQVSDLDTVYRVKDMLEQRDCGLKAMKMNLMAGRRLMENFQTLSEFSGVDNVRAMEA